MYVISELISDEAQQRSNAALSFYDERLKPLLEPQENGRMVAIHLPSGEYLIEDTYPCALQALRELHPAGMIIALHIGPSLQAPAIYRAFAHRGEQGAEPMK